MKDAARRSLVVATLAAVAAVASVMAGAARAADAVSPPAASEPAPPAPLEASATVATAGGEPAVKHTVIDEKSAHIDELRVRGQLKTVTVRPKGIAPEYEVLTGSNARDLPEEGKNQSSGLAGKRVWSLLRF